MSKRFYCVFFKNKQPTSLFIVMSSFQWMDCSSLPLTSQRVLPLLGKQKQVWVSGPHPTSVGSTNNASTGTTGLRSSATFEVGLRQNKSPVVHQEHLKTSQVGLFPDFWSTARAFPPWREDGVLAEQKWCLISPNEGGPGLKGFFDNFPITWEHCYSPFSVWD